MDRDLAGVKNKNPATSQVPGTPLHNDNSQLPKIGKIVKHDDKAVRTIETEVANVVNEFLTLHVEARHRLAIVRLRNSQGIECAVPERCAALGRCSTTGFHLVA
jgi:hypothetical protein